MNEISIKTTRLLLRFVRLFLDCSYIWLDNYRFLDKDKQLDRALEHEEYTWVAKEADLCASPTLH